MKKNQKINLVIILITISLTTFLTIELSNTGLKGNFETGAKFKELFSDSISSQFKSIYAYGSVEDTIYCYSYKDKYMFIIWELNKYKNIKSLSVNYVDRIQDFHFVFYNSIVLNGLTIMRKPIRKEESQLIINIPNNIKIKESQNEAFYFSANRFGLSYPYERRHIIFDFQPEKKEINLMLLKKENRVLILLLYPLDNNQLEELILPEFLKQPTTNTDGSGNFFVTIFARGSCTE